MSGQGQFFDYVVIVLLASGVVALGARDLSQYASVERFVNEGPRELQLREFREDLSSELAEGVPAEQLMPKTEGDMKARYPWEVRSTAEEKDKEKADKSLTSRIQSLFGGSNADEK